MTRTKILSFFDRAMKLYVREDVLRDYNTGIICVLANDFEEAINLVEAKYWRYYASECSPTACKVVTEPEAFAVHWGG